MDEPWRKLSSRELRGNSISFPAVKKFKILDYVQSFENHGITATSLLSIQISTSGQCRVTFAQQSFASSICKHGLRMDGSHIFPIAVDESLHSVQIHIHDVPIWVSNAAVYDLPLSNSSPAVLCHPTSRLATGRAPFGSFIKTSSLRAVSAQQMIIWRGIAPNNDCNRKMEELELKGAAN